LLSKLLEQMLVQLAKYLEFVEILELLHLMIQVSAKLFVLSVLDQLLILEQFLVQIALKLFD